MRRLRVAYLPASLERGGAERQMLALAERLPSDRFEVEFVAISGAGSYDARANAAGIPVRSLGDPPGVGRSRATRAARRALKVVRYAALARSARYDIVDAWLYPADVLAALTRGVTRTPVIVAGQRNVDPRDDFGVIEGRISALTRRMTDAVIANSAAAAAYAVDRVGVDPSRMRIIRNGVEEAVPLSDEERAAGRRALGGVGAEVLIGCVANYLPVKRHTVLIAAFAGLVAEGHPVRLVLIGDGPMRREMEAEVERLALGPFVSLHGSLAEPRSIVGAFDVVVQASSREGMPNALLEAAAAGRAIVATAAGGTAEIILDGETGLLVSIEDAGALTSALRRLVVDGDLRDRLGRAARAHATATFGMDRFVAEFAALYEGLADAKRVRR